MSVFNYFFLPPPLLGYPPPDGPLPPDGELGLQDPPLPFSAMISSYGLMEVQPFWDSDEKSRK